jgi:Sigma-70 region 2
VPAAAATPLTPGPAGAAGTAAVGGGPHRPRRGPSGAYGANGVGDRPTAAAGLGSRRVACQRVSLAVEPFERHRAHLTRVGYRITGSAADAEDAVQEAWLRFAALGDADRAAIRDERAWLTTVVGRLCLDRLRSAASRRERYVGPWLPEPLVTTDERWTSWSGTRACGWPR